MELLNEAAVRRRELILQKKRWMSRWKELIKCACLHQLINSKPKKVETFVTPDFVMLHLCSKFLSCE